MRAGSLVRISQRMPGFEDRSILGIVTELPIAPTGEASTAKVLLLSNNGTVFRIGKKYEFYLHELEVISGP